MKVKKAIVYFYKLIKDPRRHDILRIIRHVKPTQCLRTLTSFLSHKPCWATLKNEKTPVNIYWFLAHHNYQREMVSPNIYRWEFDGHEFFGAYDHFFGLQDEYLSGLFREIYAGEDWNDKTVLDIGGYVGDSALYFLEQGAKKIVIYEPVELNVRAMNYNLVKYKDKVELHQKAISASDGPCVIESGSQEGSLGFGFCKGPFSVTCEGISFQSLLKQHRVDAIKIDCEGAEAFLLGVDPKELAVIPFWMVETHSKEIYQSIRSYFLNAGFVLEKEFVMSPEVDLLHFRLPK